MAVLLAALLVAIGAQQGLALQRRKLVHAWSDKLSVVLTEAGGQRTSEVATVDPLCLRRCEAGLDVSGQVPGAPEAVAELLTTLLRRKQVYVDDPPCRPSEATPGSVLCVSLGPDLVLSVAGKPSGPSLVLFLWVSGA
jgi:hypothetical protein